MANEWHEYVNCWHLYLELFVSMLWIYLFRVLSVYDHKYLRRYLHWLCANPIVTDGSFANDILCQPQSDKCLQIGKEIVLPVIAFSHSAVLELHMPEITKPE